MSIRRCAAWSWKKTTRFVTRIVNFTYKNEGRQSTCARRGPSFDKRAAGHRGGAGKPTSMILNAYTILVLFTNLLRWPAALLTLSLGVFALVTWIRASTVEDRKRVEDRSYLLIMLVVLLLGLNILSWPLFYFLLQSYVPQWAGVMCIYGVTRVGTGSEGPSGYLPALITAVQFIKPALVFACGAWFVVYLANRQTSSGVLTRRVLIGAIVLGALSLADSSLEAAYVVIPKTENLPNAGCCAAARPDWLDSGLAPRSRLGEASAGPLYAAYFFVNGLAITGLLGHALFPNRRPRDLWLVILFVTVLASIPISLLFLTEIAAPRILHLPLHHCAYDLVTRAPESVAGMVLFVFGAFAVGWACVASWLARKAETRGYVTRLSDKLLYLGLFGYVSSFILMSMELWVNPAL